MTTAHVRRLVPALPLAVLAAALLAAIPAPATAGARFGEPIQLEVDISEAAQSVFHSRLVIPVEPGPLTLYYPKWIPGEHGPTGPVADLAGLRFTAGGHEVAWQRDPLDMYTFRLEVPAGADTLEASLDYLTPTGAGQFSSGPASSARLAVLSWNTVLLYPEGRPAADVAFRPALTLPAGWGFGTALEVAAKAGERVEFRPVSLVTLVDSPVAAGAHHRTVPLTGERMIPHSIELVADSEAALAMTPEQQTAYRDLVREGLALFGGHHYRHYQFLFALSDHVESFGLEHHESSDNRLGERTLIDPDLFTVGAGLLPHEFVHSWNAKYRRPAGLATPDYQTPMVDDLLWVYEGLTSYLGTVLTARSGLWTAEHTREDLALIAAGLDNRPGRQWRPLGDTTRAAQVLFGARGEGASWRRGVDFYDEGVLIWLEADTVIRRQTGGERSLDDFCRAFFGPPSGPPQVLPYTFDDLVAALGEIADHDWRGFFAERVDRVNPHAPIGGLTGGGWELVYTPEINAHQKLQESANHTTDLRFSLGLTLRDEPGAAGHGGVVDVVAGSPAAEAGMGPGMKLVAVDGRRWSPEVLRRAVADAAGEGEAAGGPIELLAEEDEFFHTFALDYHGGERYPHLERREGAPDLLGDILAPRTTRPGEAEGDAEAGG
jgi:predicted metalloprotease with PDZ domain